MKQRELRCFFVMHYIWNSYIMHKLENENTD